MQASSEMGMDEATKKNMQDQLKSDINLDAEDPFERYFGMDANLFYTTAEERDLMIRA